MDELTPEALQVKKQAENLEAGDLLALIGTLADGLAAAFLAMVDDEEDASVGERICSAIAATKLEQLAAIAFDLADDFTDDGDDGAEDAEAA